MAKTPKSVSNEDLFFLVQRLYGLTEKIQKDVQELKMKNDQDHQEMKTMIANSVGDISRMDQNMAVGDYHSQEHFTKDAQQDTRLTRIETYLQLPELAF